MLNDVYIIGIMVTGILLFGDCGLLFYRKARMPVIDGLHRATNTQTQVICKLNRKHNRYHSGEVGLGLKGPPEFGYLEYCVLQ